MIRSHIALLLTAVVIFSGNRVNAQNWVDLVHGGNLDGWEKRNGTAEYRLEGDQIIGISKVGTKSTYLCTKERYGDFILEVDVKVDVGLNSGIQFRSNSIADYKNGAVHGYQCEIDPSERKWSGGIFDQSRRGWIYPVTMNKPGRRAFKNGTWNQYRIEAIGSQIRTWVNGVQVTNLVDDMTAEGFIAFQVHSIGNDQERDGLQVRWKGARILTENLEEFRWPVSSLAKEFSYLKNELTTDEKRQGFRLLWDGKTTKGWRGARMDKFPENGWEIRDGELYVLESGGDQSKRGGDIVTVNKFSNFELELDFKITAGANSGIKYFINAGEDGTVSSVGCEFQILDDKLHPDAKMGLNGNRTVGSLYDLIPAQSYSEPNKKKRGANPGEWCKARIIVQGSHVEHYLNNIKVVEYERHTQMFRALVAYSKYAKRKNFGQAESGHILLQDHGNTVAFRSIKIRELLSEEGKQFFSIEDKALN